MLKLLCLGLAVLFGVALEAKGVLDLPSVHCAEGTYPHGPLRLRRFGHAESS